MKSAIFLFLAILSEVIATTALKLSDGFTKPVPGIIVVVGYGAAFYLLALCLRTIPVGVAYAIWSGVGIVLVAAAGVVIWREPVDAPRVIGTLLIISGIVIMNLFSKASTH
jgi:small multidrug resistance pump